MPTHEAAAVALIDEYTKGGPSAQVVAAAIEAHALLAIAEQLRIANRIALANARVSSADAARILGEVPDGE